MTQKTLKQFYREIQQWIDDGCPRHEVFGGCRALCLALEYWEVDDGGALDILTQELTTSFADAGLHDCYPFNETKVDFNREAIAFSIYKNPARLQWIKEHSK